MNCHQLTFKVPGEQLGIGVLLMDTLTGGHGRESNLRLSGLKSAALPPLFHALFMPHLEFL